jgi:hypothetical protein
MLRRDAECVDEIGLELMLTPIAKSLYNRVAQALMTLPSKSVALHRGITRLHWEESINHYVADNSADAYGVTSVLYTIRWWKDPEDLLV